MQCVRQLPVIEKLAREFEGGVSFVKVETREDGPTLDAFDVDSYPAYLVFLDGEEYDRLTLNFAPWYLEDRLRRMIERALERASSRPSRQRAGGG